MSIEYLNTMAKQRLRNQIFENYIYENQDVRDLCQEVVYKWYLDKHHGDKADLWFDIKGELELMEELEEYERCALLNDIIKRFE